jgi:ArsR family metal-binding transcriptional regulator
MEGQQSMTETYLDSITLTRTLPCLAEPGKIIVVGRPSRSLVEVLPYLATLPNVITYNPPAQALTLRRQPGLITLAPERVTITQVKDSQEGLELLAALVEAINATWEHRLELVAVTSARRAPRPLDIWALLPQTNCKVCGEVTCMAFAFGLVQARRKPVECLPLRTEPAFADRRATLEAIF